MSALVRPVVPALPRYFPLTRRDVAGIAGFWALFGLFRVADIAVPSLGPPDPVGLLLVTAGESLCWVGITVATFWLVEHATTAGWSRIRQAACYTLIGATAALTMSGISGRLRAAERALRHTAPAAPAEVALGAPRRPPPRLPYWLLVGNTSAIYLGVLAAGLARTHILRARGERAQGAELSAQLARAQLAALRRRLDPHFLFNTLNLATALVDPDPAGARRVLAQLGGLLRTSLDDADAAEVPLARELDFVGHYLDIVRTRFGARLTVDVRVDPAVVGALVPPLVLQPLVENAVKHGVERVRGPARVAVAAECQGGDVVLRVFDNGPGDARGPLTLPGPGARRDAPPVGGRGMGLATTAERLALLYGPGAQLALRPVAGGGTEAVVRVPFRPALDPGPARPAAP